MYIEWIESISKISFFGYTSASNVSNELSANSLLPWRLGVKNSNENKKAIYEFAHGFFTCFLDPTSNVIFTDLFNQDERTTKFKNSVDFMSKMKDFQKEKYKNIMIPNGFIGVNLMYFGKKVHLSGNIQKSSVKEKIIKKKTQISKESNSSKKRELDKSEESPKKKKNYEEFKSETDESENDK